MRIFASHRGGDHHFTSFFKDTPSSLRAEPQILSRWLDGQTDIETVTLTHRLTDDPNVHPDPSTRLQPVCQSHSLKDAPYQIHILLFTQIDLLPLAKFLSDAYSQSYTQ